jgi:hypothetical protein
MADQPATIEQRLDSLETGAQGFQQRLVAVEFEATKIPQIDSDLASVKSEVGVLQTKTAVPVVTTAPTAPSSTAVTLDDLLEKLGSHGIRFSEDELHELAYRKSSGDGKHAGDWTSAGRDSEGFPVPKGSATDIS